MEENSQFIDACLGSIIAARTKWGECSFEHIQTENAWYSAGVGESSSCAGASIIESELISFEIYPNPSTEYVTIKLQTTAPKTIQLFSNTGQVLKTFTNVLGETYTVDVSSLTKGSYYITVNGNVFQTKVLIKN